MEKEEEITLDAQLLVPVKVPVNDPVKEPVLICSELDTTPTGNMVGANEAVVAKDAVAGVKVILVAALAVVANEDDIAVVALPLNDPVKPMPIA